MIAVHGSCCQRCPFCIVLIVAAAAAAAIVRCTPAAAHSRSISYSTWDIRGRQARVAVRLSTLDLSRLAWASRPQRERDRLLDAYLIQRLQLRAADVPCSVVGGPRALEAVPGRAVYEWRLACPPAGRLKIRSALFLEVAPSHLHFARVRIDGGAALERVLSDGEREWSLVHGSAQSAKRTSGTSLLGYVHLGIRHILTGYDHLAFLLALLLLESAFLDVAKVVTGFTVAHSITLGLAVLGYVRPQSGAIEALIGLSIALVAVENVWLVSRRSPVLPWVIAATLGCLALVAGRGYGRVPAMTLAGLALFSLCYFGLLRRVARPAPLRWAIAFIFGLVHGFGFAAILLEANLSAGRLAQALFGFNLGVEIGQLAAVALLWPVLYIVGRPGHDRSRLAILEIGSAAVCGLGLFWFVTRAYG
ncbi:MAG: HupE/UreJ family protein [Candidatus Binatia bacterium]